MAAAVDSPSHKNSANRLSHGESEATINQWKNRVVHEKKVTVVKDINKLHIQIQSMEREKTTHIYSKRGDFYTDFQHLYEMEMTNNEERLQEKEKLKQELTRISAMVKKFHRELQGVKPTAAFVERLKSTLEDVESTINNYKNQQRIRYEELMANEKSLSHEVGALNAKYDSWAQITSATQSKVKVSNMSGSSSARDVTQDMPEDVARFKTFMQKTGGVRGGWDEYDHQTFLKLWLRYNTRVSDLMCELRTAVPTRNDREIREHVAWYREYIRLDELKKTAIQTWRTNKQIEKELVGERQECADEEEGDRERRRLEVIENERKKRFSGLNAWKVQKEIERMADIEQKVKVECERKRKDADERQKQLEIKSRLLEYKKQRDEDEDFLEGQRLAWEEEEEEYRKQLSARERSRFLDRDQQKLNAVLEKKQQILDEEEKRKEKLNKTKQPVSVDRDRSRLYQPTEGWKHRLRDNQSDTGNTQALYIPHRAVPSWRQNVT